MIFLRKLSQFISPIKKDLFAKLFTAWIFVCSFMLTTAHTVSVDTFRHSNISLIVIAIVALFSFFTVLQIAFSEIGIVQIALIIGVTFFGTVMLISNLTLFSMLSVAIIVAVTMLYVKNSKARIFFPIKRKNLPVLIIVLIFASLTAYIAIMRIVTYSAPNYDFGIWCNMFHHMKESFLPISSCERDRLMSHFCVHFSPIYYVLLPFYMIIPSPYTLNIAQVVVLYSGIIPVIKLMQCKKIDKLTTVFFAVIYSSLPAVSMATFYDIHENCFLLPILMWAFFFYETGKTAPFFIFCVLTLLVKEDAFIYLVIFALFILFDRKDFKKGFILIVVAIVYFAVTATLMKKYGLGIMSDRFSNLKTNDEGLFGVIKTAFLNPAYFFSQLFFTDDNTADKIKYFVELFFPLCFMPFMSKRTSRFLLLSPVLINLITTYIYQYDISKQYSFGISAFLIYASILNISEKEKSCRRFICVTATMMSVILCLSAVIPKVVNYRNVYRIDKENITKISEVLERLPDDASVSVSTFLLQKISDRDEVYELEYHEKPDTDYMVVDERYLTEELEKNYISKYIDAGYKVVDGHKGIISVYRK